MSAGQLVSVVLPTYNRARTLPRAIASVLAQTHSNLELIVVDDGSSDDTQAVLAGIGDPRLRGLPLARNGGVSAARNQGVAAARGDLIAFQDSDDEWRLTKLEQQVRVWRAGVVLVVCDSVYVDDALGSNSVVPSDQAVVDMTANVAAPMPGAPCWLADKGAIRAAGGFDEELDCFEDWDLALRLSERGRVMMVPRPLVVCQRTPGSLFSREPNYIPNLQRILARHEARLKRYPAGWAAHCNLLGQSLCQFRSCAEGRAWFIRALRAQPLPSRGWVNLLCSFFGVAMFRRYVRLARALRALAAVAPFMQLADGR